MRLEIIDEDYYKIFINNFFIKDINYNNKEELGSYVKDIVLRIKKTYNITLKGLYEVHVYVIRYIGVILEIKNIDSYLSKNVDLKIVLHNDDEIYLKVLRYELVSDYNSLKYFNNCFYINVNNIKKNDIYKLIENYNIVYGEELAELKSKWVHLT